MQALTIGSYFSQTTIAKHSFETSGDTWAIQSLSTPDCNISGDVWSVESSLSSITPSDGAMFWGIRDLTGNCGSSAGESITFANVDVSSFTGVSLKFDYQVIGYDSGDDMFYEVFLDNIGQGQVQVVNGNSNFSTGGWLTETISIPNATTNVRIVLKADQNGGSDYGGFDNVRLEGATSCTAPSTQASSASTSGVGLNSGTISWTRGNGDNVLVVLQAGSAAATPASGTGYTANAAFGSGDALGTGFVVFNGTGTSVNVSNLTPNTTYHYAIHEFNNASTCYNNAGLTGTFTTLAVGTNSDIITAGGESATVPNSAIQAGPLTSVQGVKVWDFTIRDGGAGGDTDALPTILEDLVITQSAGNAMNDWDVAIQSADIFDGTTHIATGTITSNQISFTGMSISTPDDASKTITMRISLNCPANNSNNQDGDDFGFRISQGNVTEASGLTSQFASFPLINSSNGQNVFTISPIAITSITPTSGPVGTNVTINATGGGLTGVTSVSFGGTAATSFTVVSDNQIIAKVAPGTSTGDVNVVDANCIEDNFTQFTLLDKATSGCEGTVIFSDIIISEVYDNSSGSLGYIEIYNGTGATVDLTTYTIARYGTLGAGTPSHSYTFPASGIGSSIANGEVLVGRISNGGSGLEDFVFGNLTGFNADDRLELLNGGTIVDDFHDALVGVPGYVYRRNTTITGPNAAFDVSEWDATATAGDRSNLGTYSVSAGSGPTVATQPTTTQICAQSAAVLTTAGTEGFAGGLGLVYQWFESAPGSSTWTTMTNGGVVSGATSPTLTISPAAGFNDYQYYCEIRENTATCFAATNAVQLDVFGDGGTAGLWQGGASTDWCECFNWDDGKIPVNVTAVTIDQTAARDCEVTTGCTATAASVTVSSNNATNRNLTISGSGSLSIATSLAVSKTAGTGSIVVATTGTSSLTANTLTLSGTTANNAIFRNETASTSVDINGDLTINANGLLDLNANGTLNLGGHYNNLSTATGFDEASSTIVFDGAANQNINTDGFTEVFHNITLAKTGGALVLQDPINVDNSGVVALSDDQINLNGVEMKVLNNATNTFTRTTGSIVDESGAAAGMNSGKLTWAINANTASYVYPFADGIGGTFIPFTYQLTAGNAGEVSISTYGTGANNQPLPAGPDPVTNLNSIGGLTPDNRAATVDRFWQIDVQNAPTATMTFSYAASELPVAPFNVSTSMQAQRYDVVTDTWNRVLFPGQTTGVIPGGFTVTVPNITAFSPWAVAHVDSPLPVELMSFEVEKIGEDKSKLEWVTASELNCNFFEIQRSNNGEAFETIGTVQASGNSSNERFYNWVDEQPLNGTNYYRLKTVDFDGHEETSVVRMLYFYNAFSVMQSDVEWVVKGKKAEDFTYELFNTLGQKIDVSNVIVYNEGHITINNESLNTGVYLLLAIKSGVAQSFKLIKR